MKLPSIVSSRLMPAANSTGSVRIAYQGRPLAAPVPARTRNATSVAVSKPRPKSSPTPYICRGVRIEPVSFLKNLMTKPRSFRWLSSSLSLKRPCLSSLKTLRMPTRTAMLMAAMR